MPARPFLRRPIASLFLGVAAGLSPLAAAPRPQGAEEAPAKVRESEDSIPQDLREGPRAEVLRILEKELEALAEPGDEAAKARKARFLEWRKDLARIPKLLDLSRELSELGLSVRQREAERELPLPPRRVRLPEDFGDMETGETGFWLDVQKTELEGLRSRLRQEIQDLEAKEKQARERLRKIQEHLLESKARTVAVLNAEGVKVRERLTRVEAELNAKGGGSPGENERRILKVLAAAYRLELRVLEREREQKTTLRKVLETELAQCDAWLKRLSEERLAPLREDLQAVDERLAEVRRRLLPEAPDIAGIEGLPLDPETRKGVQEVFDRARARVAASIREIALRAAERRRLATEKKRIRTWLEEAKAKVEEHLETTAPGKQSSEDVLFYKLRKARQEIERYLDLCQADPRWRVLPGRLAELKQLLAEAARRRAGIEEAFDAALESALGPGRSLPAALESARRRWIDLERQQAEAMVVETEQAMTLAFEVLALLQEQRRVLEQGLRDLRRRGLFLRDPERFQGLLGLPSVLARDGAKILEGLGRLPSLLLGIGGGAGERSGISIVRRILAWLLPLLGLFLSFLGLRRSRSLLAALEGRDEVPKREVHWLAFFGLLRRAGFWVLFGIGMWVMGGAGTLAPRERALLQALGGLSLTFGLWWGSLKVALRPLRSRLRLFPLNDRLAGRVHRLLLLGLLFWLLGQGGRILGALVPADRARAVSEGLDALREGGLLLVFFLLLLQRRLVDQLVKGDQDGGFAFLRNFYRFFLWPARLTLSAALLCWILSYHGLAVMCGRAVLGLFGGVALAALFHEAVVEELRFRFQRRWGAGDGSGAAEGEKDPKDRSKSRLTLFGDYLEIAELLGTLAVALAGASWILGFDRADWALFGDAVLWGGKDLEVRAYDLGLCLLGLYLTWAVARRMRRTVETLLEGSSTIDRGLRYTLGTMTSYLVSIVGALISFSFIRVGISQLQWMLAALGVGIGFGLQDIVSNFFSGLILLFERPLKVGDIVRVGTTLGEVKRITIRSTTVTSFDNIDVIVPNKDFISQPITNWTGTDQDMRSTIEVGVAYGSDLKKVREILLETVRGHGRVYRKPEPAVFAKGFGASSVDFQVVYWTHLDFKRSTFSDLHFAIYKALEREGIEIPFPQTDVHVRDLPDARSGDGLKDPGSASKA